MAKVVRDLTEIDIAPDASGLVLTLPVRVFVETNSWSVVRFPMGRLRNELLRMIAMIDDEIKAHGDHDWETYKC